MYQVGTVYQVYIYRPGLLLYEYSYRRSGTIGHVFRSIVEQTFGPAFFSVLFCSLFFLFFFFPFSNLPTSHPVPHPCSHTPTSRVLYYYLMAFFLSQPFPASVFQFNCTLTKLISLSPDPSLFNPIPSFNLPRFFLFLFSFL